MAIAKRVKASIVWLAAALAILFLIGGCAERLIDGFVNKVPPRSSEPPAADAVHDGLFIADLHADTLMWDRDLLQENTVGHVDLPRLKAGNVRLQAFTVVTKTPLARETVKDFDCVTGTGIDWSKLIFRLKLSELANINFTGALALLQPARIKYRSWFDAWFDLEARALYQARRLDEFARMSQTAQAERDGIPKLIVIRTVHDLARVVESRGGPRYVIGALLGLEGAHWLGEDGLEEAEIEAGVERLYEAGFRMIALTHRFDNGLGGASEDCAWPPPEDKRKKRAGKGLTEAGKIVVRQAESLGMVIDLAHASSQTIEGVIDMAKAPVVVSHTGVQGSCEDKEKKERKGEKKCRKYRNFTKADVLSIARNDGVIGIGFWPEAVGKGVPSIVRAMAHVEHLLAENEVPSPCGHLAFGSDFDGAVETPFDAARLALLTREMRQPSKDGEKLRCLSEGGLASIAGANVCRVLAMRLPGGGADSAAQICGKLTTYGATAAK